MLFHWSCRSQYQYWVVRLILPMEFYARPELRYKTYHVHHFQILSHCFFHLGFLAFDCFRSCGRFLNLLHCFLRSYMFFIHEWLRKLSELIPRHSKFHKTQIKKVDKSRRLLTRRSHYKRRRPAWCLDLFQPCNWSAFFKLYSLCLNIKPPLLQSPFSPIFIGYKWTLSTNYFWSILLLILEPPSHSILTNSPIQPKLFDKSYTLEFRSRTTFSVRWDPEIQVKPGSPLGGVLLAFDKFQVSLKEAKMLPDDPTLVHYPVSFEALIFAPLPGERITASLTHVL